MHITDTVVDSNVMEADQAMEKFLEYPNDWSQKTAINFLNTSLNYDKTAFEVHFSKIENMIRESDDLWLKIIYVFVKYILLYPEGADKNHFYIQTMEYIKRVSTDSIRAKCNFLDAIQWEQAIPKDIQEIFQAIILSPFENDQCPLHIIDDILYRQAENGSFETVMKCMLDIFRINKYHHRYTEFFDGFSSTTCELSKCSEQVTRAALAYMLTDNIDQVFFGLGWLMKSGNLQMLLHDQEEGNLLISNAQAIRVMKAVLYFSADCLRTCSVAFQLLTILCEPPDKYISFCMDEVYENYPGTMFDTSKNYTEVSVDSQNQLAELVSKAHVKRLHENETISKIKDLRPSWEHQYIYRRALQEQNKQINKKVNEQSIFGRFFSNRTLKYGVRSAHIVQGTKGERFYQSAPYQQFTQKMEVPAHYVNDPVGFAMKKSDFWNEVISSAHDN